MLLPLDYVLHNSHDSLIWFDLPDNVILYAWKSKYWITFLLTWLILPILQEYYRSGQFRSYSRLRDALKKNLRFQLIIIGVSIMGGIYLLLEAGLSLSHLKMMIIALSHIYSLILVLWLMAHGLINIPRNKWVFGNLVSNLNYYYLKVPKVIDELEDCKISFKEDILQVLVLTKNFTNDLNDSFVYRDWILSLNNKIPEDLKDFMEIQYVNDAANVNITRDQLNDEFMTNLTANFNSNLNKLVAYESEFNTLFGHIITLEDLLNPSNSSINPNFRLDNFNSFISPKYRYLFLYYINPILNRVYSIMLFSLSFIIIQSEFFHSTKLSLINVIIYKIHSNLFQFILCCLIFSYMLICGLNSLTKLKIFNKYYLVPHKSDPVSTSFYSTYIARLTIPLSYNFITLFISRASIFEDWFGKSIHLTGLFNLMNNWIPRLVLIPIILTLFNVYDRLKRKLGISGDLYDSLGFDQDNDSQVENHKRKDLIIAEAKRIVNREMNKRISEDLRPFNLSTAADTNYNANRNFDNSLLNSNMNIDNSLLNSSNRIDSYQDDPSSPSTPSIWNRLGTGLTNFGQQLSSRLQPASTNPVQYTDEALDNFDYDEDANNNLVV